MKAVLMIGCLCILFFLGGCGTSQEYSPQEQNVIDGCFKFLNSFHATSGICGDNNYCVKITDSRVEFVDLSVCSLPR